MMRGYRIAMTEPRGPVYLCFDVDVQEESITETPRLSKRGALPAARIARG